jgi:GH15 family glucan-1,4-alpha-glucosidase
MSRPRLGPAPVPGAQLGNFPQAYVHMGLINAATELDEALD